MIKDIEKLILLLASISFVANRCERIAIEKRLDKLEFMVIRGPQ
jgi:hypothetical protein